MPESDLDRRLAALARRAGRAGHLDSAAEIRIRADRRRRRRSVGTAALGVVAAVALGAGIALAQPKTEPHPGPPVSSTPAPAPTASTPPPATPTTPSHPTPSRPSSGDIRTGALTGAEGPFTAKRHYWFVPIVDGQQGPAAVRSLTASGRVDVTSDNGANALFTTAGLGPTTDEWLIRVDRQGGSQCLSVQTDGTLSTRTCLPADRGQAISYYEAGPDGQGRMRYAIRVGKDALDLAPEAYLDWDPQGSDGLLVRNTSRSALLTTWVLVDRGPSTLAR